MRQRTKKVVIANVSLQIAQEASEQYAKIVNKQSGIEAAMNKELDEVKSKYQDDITQCEEFLKEPLATLEAFVREQQPNWGTKKSYELLHCKLGYRTGMPTVTKDKRYTWDGIKDIIAKLFPDLIRSKTEIDKEAIIALSKTDGFTSLKDQCFIDVEQKETFFVEVKKEEVAA